MPDTTRFSRASFARGVARVIDLGARLNRTDRRIPRDGATADAKALGRDWRAVGNDIQQAARRVGRESAG